jgi:hypothetical protein|tara:strand:+ start:1405 stop:1794 length:390 start_codon:yes stop_codon:yes gene_type:complete
MRKLIKQSSMMVATLALVGAANATVLSLGENGAGEVYMDASAMRFGNASLTIHVDIADATHGSLRFENIEEVELLTCNLVGSTFTANGFTCEYTGGYLTGLSPAPEAFRVESSGTSETMTVSFGLDVTF